MEKKAHKQNAVKWQFEGHRTKVSTHNLLITLIAATIGFAATLAVNCECGKSILLSCIAAPLFCFSLILLFLTLILSFILLRSLQIIAFEYSNAHGNFSIWSEDNYDKAINEFYEKIDGQHKGYRLGFNVMWITYCASIFLLISSILITIYSNNKS